MRILFFIESLGSGGKERRLVELVSSLTRTSVYECMIVVMSEEDHYYKRLPKSVVIQVIRKGRFRKDISIFRKFYKVCRSFGPDIIHVWGNMPAFYVLPSAIKLHIPLVNSQITDSQGITLNKPFSFLIAKMNFKYAKVVTSNSCSGMTAYGFDRNRVKVIYNGVSMDRFNIVKDVESIKNEFNIKTKYSIVMVGSFTEYKNFDLFIDAAKYYQKRRRDLTFIAIGSGYNFEHIKHRTIKEEIHNVLLTGAITNVEELVSICDIGILLSPFGEGISNAVVEYMALRKPVIASNKGGNAELVVNNKNGILIKEDTLLEMTQAIDLLLADENLRKEFGQNNREKIEKQFTVELMTNEFIKVYNEL
jgi:glycosyltransferase involved in cell wall biosynthesis